MTALDDAIRAHLADTDDDGTIVTHWTLVVGVMQGGDGDGFWVTAPDGQPGYVSQGLLHAALTARMGDDQDDTD